VVFAALPQINKYGKHIRLCMISPGHPWPGTSRGKNSQPPPGGCDFADLSFVTGRKSVSNRTASVPVWQ